MLITHTDGYVEEYKLLTLLREAADVGSTAFVGSAHYADPAIRRALSPVSGNLLRPLSFEGLSVLQLGAGTGTLSRLIAEQAERFVFTEENPAKLAIIQERLRDLGNWEAGINDSNERFDVLFVLGRLPTPQELGRLKEDGVVLSATTNKLGLSAFSSNTVTESTEHHLSYFETKQKLAEHGFSQLHEFFPFPNYEEPKAVLTREFIARRPDIARELLAADENGFFPQSLAIESVVEAHLFFDFANSFLFLSAREAQTRVVDALLQKMREKGELAWHYSLTRRHPALTVFCADQANELGVEKRPFEATGLAARRLVGKTMTVDWTAVPRQTLATGELVVRTLARNAHQRKWNAFSKLLEDFLAHVFDIEGSTIAGTKVDALITNTLCDQFNFNFIDQEWSVEGEIPKSWAVFRNVFVLFPFRRCLAQAAPFPTFRVLYETLCQRFGVTPDFDGDLRREAEFQHLCTGTSIEEAENALRGMLEFGLDIGAFPRQPGLLEQTQRQLALSKQENEVLKRKLNGPLKQQLKQELKRKVKATVQRLPIRNGVFTKSFPMQEKELFHWDLPVHACGFVTIKISGKWEEGGQVNVFIPQENGKAQLVPLFLLDKRRTLTRVVRLDAPISEIQIKFDKPATASLRQIKISQISRNFLGPRLLPTITTGILKRPIASVKEVIKNYQVGGRHAVKEWLKFEVLGRSLAVLENYTSWVKLYDTLTDDDREQIRAHIKTFEQHPLLSVVMPVYNIDEKFLRLAIESVRKQIYPNWEFCIADDASPKPHVRKVLEEYAKLDPRIKVAYRPKNGHISAASNTALELVTGEFTLLLDHDDELAEHALYMVAAEVNAHPNVDLIYSDEDKIDTKGKRFCPHFKPEWNQHLFYSLNLITHLAAFRTEVLKKTEGFRVGYEGSQDYDLMLRFVELTTVDRIRHIPHILYHWRAIPGSVALAPGEKNYAHEAARRAITDHFERTQTPAESMTGIGAIHRMKYFLPMELPLVSAIICTRDRKELVETVITGLLEKTDYPNLEIILIDNGSESAEALKYFQTISKNPKVRVFRREGAFNFSALNNFGAYQAKGEILALLNNDLKVRHADWLKELVSFAHQSSVGAVAPRLIYANDTIQHAGVVLGVNGGVADHRFRGLAWDAPGYLSRNHAIAECSAVTAACMVVRKKVFFEVNGLDSENLAVGYNDIDFCLKLMERGYKNIFTPFAELYHLESVSRGLDTHGANKERLRAETAYMKQRWGKLLKNDPHYSPNLTVMATDYSCAFPPRVVKPWKFVSLKAALQKEKGLDVAAEPSKLNQVTKKTRTADRTLGNNYN